MAEIMFAKGLLLTSEGIWEDAYQMSADRRGIVTNVQITNTSGSSGSDVLVSLAFYDSATSTGGSARYSLIEYARIPVGTALKAITDRVTLEESDKIQARLDSSGSAAVVINGIEVTT